MVFIINSAPGVGKSTLLKELQDKLHNGFALLDGDDIGRTVPLENTNEWLNLIQDNMVSCCINFRKYGKRNIGISKAIEHNQKIKEMKSDYQLDTTTLNKKEVSNRICKFLLSNIL